MKPRHAVARLCVVVAALVMAALPAGSSTSPRIGSLGHRPGELDTPVGVAFGDGGGSIYVADFYNHRVQRFSRDGAFIQEWGSHGSGDGEFDGPVAVAVDGEGDVFVADLYNHRIEKFSADGRFIGSWGTLGSEYGQFRGPFGVAVAPGAEVFVADLDNHRVQKFSNDGRFLSAWGSRGARPGQFDDPWGIAVDARGFVYVADHGNDRIQKFAGDGTFLEAIDAGDRAGEKLVGPTGVAVDRGGRIYVTDGSRHVHEFDARGGFLAASAAEPGSGVFTALTGIAVDPIDQTVRYADPAHHRIESLAALQHDAPAAAAVELPRIFMMQPAWPNPSRGSMRLRFGLPRRGHLTVGIYGVDGRLVTEVVDRELEPGTHDLTWDGLGSGKRLAPAGLYFVRSTFSDDRGLARLHGRLVLLR